MPGKDTQLKSKKTKKSDSFNGTSDKTTKPEPSKSKAPHYDTDQRGQGTNVDVEIAKGSMGDTFQTDSRPKETN